MFVIGIDSHKDTLSACLVDHLGTALEYRTIANTPAGHRQLVSWAQNCNAARVAVEGVRHVRPPAGGGCCRCRSGCPGGATAADRPLPPPGRTQTKTDQVDALVIARVALRDHTLSAPTFWGGHRGSACAGLIPP